MRGRGRGHGSDQRPAVAQVEAAGDLLWRDLPPLLGQARLHLGRDKVRAGARVGVGIGVGVGVGVSPNPAPKRSVAPAR